MNKLLQVTLISAIFATSGFASENNAGNIVLEENGTFSVENYTNGIDVNVTVKSGGTMDIKDNITLNKERTITLAPGANGSIAKGITLTNNGTIVMNYEDGKSTGLFPSGAGNIVQNYSTDQSKVDSNIQINGIDSIAYCAGATSSLVADSTDLTGGNLKDKTAKKLTTTSEAGFTPDIPAKIASISYNDGELEHKFSDYTSIEDQTTLAKHFSDFGVSFMKTGGETAAITSYAEAKSAIDAIAEATNNEAVLIDNTPIVVGEAAKTINTNLHNINVSSAAPSFTGNGELTLSGDNRLLENATLACPVKISGQNAIPTNATFEKTLNIADDANIASTVTVKNILSVGAGKTLAISGKLILNDQVAATDPAVVKTKIYNNRGLAPLIGKLK